MKLNKQQVAQLETRDGKFTQITLALLGVELPPTKGWKTRLRNREIPEELFFLARSEAKTEEERIQAAKKIYEQAMADRYIF